MLNVSGLKISPVEGYNPFPTSSIQSYIIIEGSLETKVPTIWTDEKQHSQEEAEPGRNSDV